MDFRLRLLLLLVVVLPPGTLGQSFIGVLGIPHEVRPIEDRLEDSREVATRGYTFRVGKLSGRQVVVGRSAPGKVNAAIVATLLIGHFSPSAVFFSGTAGAIDPTLRPGDVVIGASVAQHDAGVQTPNGILRIGLRNPVTAEREPLLVPAPEKLLAAARSSASELTLPPVKTGKSERPPRITEGVIVTGDVFVTDVALRDDLRKSLSAVAVEMEGAAVVQACRQFRVPCLVVRSITDQADGQAASSYKEFVATASQNAARLVMAVIGRLP
jgi:adenosylhomocysteine nucleosidase